MVSRSAIGVGATLVAAILLASCSSSGPSIKFRSSGKEYFSEARYGRASPRVVSYGAMPKGGGRVVVGDAYRVAGKTYVPRDNPRYSATGLASWYGAAFHGRLTANGEIYDVNGLTAAHPTLPLPSYARVTNLVNGRSLVVRVNDRGPFARNRIIDVSSKVADMLGFHDNGTAKVRVDYVGPARMDGLDQRTLMASYRGGPGKGVADTLFAGLRAPAVAPQVQIAAFAQPRLRPAVPTATTDFEPPVVAGAAPLVLAPAYTAPDDDPLAPLIIRSTFVTGYA